MPPTSNPEMCSEYLTKLLSKNPIHGAKVTVTADEPGGGWNAPELSPWLEKACANASNTFFKKPCVYMGEGGSIPFMGMLGEKFPEAQFMITGVLGPQSNAHGPNEFLHIPMGKKLTASVALVLQDHLNRDRGGKPSLPARKAKVTPAKAKASKAVQPKKKVPSKAKKKAT
ncbi:MAG: acetylornithine deacetylase/succinyl-diaminopimelate desuccinylase-like protein [Planctomycetota bacterium]